MPASSTASSLKRSPLHKGIPADFIRLWITEQALCGLKYDQVRAVVGNYFCGTIQTRGVCPEDCQACRREVVDLFRLEEAKKPLALLIWVSKDHAAKWIEKLIEQQKRADQKSASEFPALESPSAPMTEQDAFDSLFSKRTSEDDLFSQLVKEYDEV
jgi:hypothetical protein